MTMDMVAARAKAGKATVYRRWSSKAELVRNALAWMNRNHLELESLPDTGTLREDLLVLLKPQSIAEEERKFRVLAGLGSFLQHPEFADAGTAGIFEPWVVVNRELMRQAFLHSANRWHSTACTQKPANSSKYHGQMMTRRLPEESTRWINHRNDSTNGKQYLNLEQGLKSEI
ncbi:TetR/AcrR family transcriptional regulator [Paenibacillus peoriae]|uniref:TetR/AcrR family transcriptional regulator n=1 Tax=Paenibacillus peoriae TaxID=59893 RepID=UPI001C4BF751|nr:TetR/AcrR family transcriptional regulator [Paenibacillus peoriae]